ncbi:MAG: HAMP domain-containing protein [Actinomycetota bacterium]|nr:HAMP domain-containing protein [Actinomycetota bacterium]
MNGSKSRGRYGRARSRVLVQLTMFISLVIILSGVGTFFLLSRSQQYIMDECVDSLLKIEARNFCSGYNYVIQLLIPEYMEKFSSSGQDDLVASVLRGEPSEMQEIINTDIEEMIDADFMGLDTFMLLIPSSQLVPEPMVWCCNDESLVQEWVAPDYINTALKNGDDYIWMENGMPELGIDEECLITLGQVESPFMSGIYFAYVGIKPMRGEIRAINAFFDNEVGSANLKLGIILAASIAVVLLIIFFLLDHLIRRRITTPLEELSAAAEDVMGGDLDVAIEVRKGEEFAGLKYVFKEMLDSLRRYVVRSTGESVEAVGGGAATRRAEAGDKRPRILFKITLLMTVVMVIYGLATYFIIRDSQENLIDSGVERMLQTEAENFFSSQNYIIQISEPEYIRDFENIEVSEVVDDILEGRISEVQRSVDADLWEMVDSGYFDLEEIMLIVPASVLTPQPMVWACNDESLIYKWEVPDYLLRAMERGDEYVLVEGGLPELGLEGDYLITLNQIDNPLAQGMVFIYAAVKPMGEEITSICAFCDEEKSKANSYLAVILGGSVILVILITFFLLDYLLSRQITRPVEELSAAADKVMRGDLDVRVDIQEGEELENLKRAFNQMVEGFRSMLDKLTDR